MEKTIRDDILATAEHALYYTNLLIKQCDSWLPEEEGRKNMEKQIMERQDKDRKSSHGGFFSRLKKYL